MSEILWGNFESNENLPKLKQASPEDIQKVWEDIEYSNHLQKVNDVLNVLDYPDNIEEKFRGILNKVNDKTLIDLANQTKEDIKTFILNINEQDTKQTENEELKEQDNESKEFETKVLKIKSIFAPELLNKNPDIAQNFEALELAETPKEKEAILRWVINLLKEPWKLKSIVDNLGWADKNNPKYLEFKNTLISIDPSFKDIFPELENINSKDSLNTNDIVWEIQKESWWLETIDLNSNTPVSKLSLEWSAYSFDEKLDKNALWELFEKNKNKLEDIQNSVTVLKGVYTPFDRLLNQIRSNWWKQDLKETLKNPLSSFPSSTFTNLEKVYKDIWIDSNMQLKESDFLSLKDVKNTNELRVKIENIKTKFEKIKLQILEAKKEVEQEYKLDFKELVKRKEETKEKQVEVLKFMKASWFDLIPKSITDKLITNLQNNSFQIQGLELNVQNIDLKNWHFWEWIHLTNEIWFNSLAKTNLVKFMNKLISWNIDEPLSVKAIANWMSVSNSSDLKNQFREAWIVDWLGWKYSRMVENLKKSSSKVS